MTSQSMNVPAGPRFGPYVLTAELGRGGMGVVYRAYDTVKGRTVALKVLIPELATDRLFRDRFRRESKRAARLSEPHIIPIHDFGQIDGRLFIDMRLVEGIDLETLLERDGPLPPAAAAWIIAQVASALDAAHADGLIHRDVKPSNILVTGHGHSMPFAYLIDFGIARAVNSASLSTGTGTIGTLAYMAPERIDGAPGDPRADVYSLACVLHECLTGRQPYPGEMVAVMWAQLNAAPPAPTAARPGLPSAVDAVVARGMAKDPSSRYGSAGELGAAILAATSGAGAASTLVPPAAEGPPAARSRPPAAGRVPPAASPVPPAGGRRVFPPAGLQAASSAMTPPAPARQPGEPSPDADVPLWESDIQARTRAALRAIVTNPDFGVTALSSAQAMTTLLRDLLPGSEREVTVLVAAAEAGLAESLRHRVARGMDLDAALAEAERDFASRTGFRLVACRWAVAELAAALCLDSAGTWRAG